MPSTQCFSKKRDFAALEKKIPNTLDFLKRQNSLHQRKKIQNTTDFAKKETMTDMLQISQMK